MSNLLPFRPVPDQIAGYRFGTAELHLAQQRLLVEGRDVPLPPMAFRLLLGLCRARGGFLSRNEMFECLWQGGGSGSDEALTQIVAKARQALGAERAVLTTLRGRGFRLEADIEVMPVAATLATTPRASVSETPNTGPEAIEPSAAPAPPARPRRWRIVALLTAAGLAATLFAVTRFWSTESEILSGLGVRVEDFGPVSAPGKAMLRTALEREDAGDRTSARQLVLPLLESEPRSAAAPFLLMLWQEGTDDARQLERLRAALDARLPADASPYMQLLRRWQEVDATGSTEEVLSAALRLQPDAWRLHQARSHILLRLRHFDAALADLRTIPVARLAPRYAVYVLSDRASLGDADAVDAEIPALAARAPEVADYVRGRVAEARRQWPAARQAYEAAAKSAEQRSLVSPSASSWLLAAAAAGQQQDWAAVLEHAARARTLGQEHAMSYLVVDAAVLAAYAKWRLGQLDEGDAELLRGLDLMVKERSTLESMRAWLQLARLRPQTAEGHLPPLDVEGDAPGGNALMAARDAWRKCDAAGARTALLRAEGAGIDDSYFDDESDLLRQDLGLPRKAPPQMLRMPYPALPRWIAYWESARPAGVRACETR